MTEQQQKETAMEKIDMNQDIITLEGAVTGRQFQIIGADCNAEKFLALMTYLIDARDPNNGDLIPHNIRSIILSENYPIHSDGKPELGMAHYTTGCIILNQSAIIDSCYADLCAPDFHLAFRAHVWVNLLTTAAHELAHMAKYHHEVTVKGNVKAIYEEHNETEIEAFGVKILTEMAKTIDMELPDLDEWHWFAGRISQCEQTFKGGTEAWQASQQMMLTDGLVYMDIGEKNITIDNVRDYMKGWYGGDPKNWPTEVPEKLVLAHHVEPETVDVVKTPTEEEIAAAEAAAAKQAEKERRLKTEALRKQLDNEYRQQMGVAEDVEVTDDQMVIFLAGRGMKLEDIEVMANPPTDTQITTNPDGSGKVIIGGFDGNEAEMDEYDDGDYEGPMDTTQMPGMGMPGAQINTGAAVVQAQQNVAVYQQNLPQPTIHPHGTPVEQVKASLTKIYEVLANHIFTKCGWMQGQLTDGTQIWYFNNPGQGVEEPVCISRDINGQPIPLVDQLVVGMDCNVGGNYRSNQQIVKDQHGNIWVKAHTSKDKTLPAFTLTVNLGDGVANKRMLMPQNPNKMKGGQLSKYAVDARMGHRYFYIINKTVQNGGILTSCKDGVWQQ